jgi:hypothetical protein
MDLTSLDTYTLLSWWDSFVKCSHYCPCECHHRNGIPDDVYKGDVFSEIIRRMSKYQNYGS